MPALNFFAEHRRRRKMDDNYPRYYILSECGKPVKWDSELDVPQSPNRRGEWEPFIDAKVLFEDGDAVTKAEFDKAVKKWIDT
jgi:hypothetical protein